MIYLAYQSQADIMRPVRALAASALSALHGTLNGSLSGFAAQPLRNLAAAYEMLSRVGLSHARPPFGIDTVMVGNREVAVSEEPAHVTPFGTLLITQVGPIGKNSESHLRMCFSDELLQPGRHKSIDLTNFRKNSE